MLQAFIRGSKQSWCLTSIPRSTHWRAWHDFCPCRSRLRQRPENCALFFQSLNCLIEFLNKPTRASTWMYKDRQQFPDNHCRVSIRLIRFVRSDYLGVGVPFLRYRANRWFALTKNVVHGAKTNVPVRLSETRRWGRYLSWLLWSQFGIWPVTHHRLISNADRIPYFWLVGKTT